MVQDVSVALTDEPSNAGQLLRNSVFFVLLVAYAHNMYICGFCQVNAKPNSATLYVIKTQLDTFLGSK